MCKKLKNIKTADEALTIQAYGDFEREYRNGEIWTFNGNEYYFSHLDLSPEELKEYNDALRIEHI